MEVVKFSFVRYNNLGVKAMVVAREQVKALIDRMTDEQVQALWIILNSMAWPEEEVSPVEAEEIGKGFKEIKEGKGIKADDLWREIGI